MQVSAHPLLPHDQGSASTIVALGSSIHENIVTLAFRVDLRVYYNLGEETRFLAGPRRLADVACALPVRNGMDKARD